MNIDTLPLPPAAPLALEVAAAACSAALDQAAKLSLHASVVVTDAAGVVVAIQRMPGASRHTLEAALDKAYTSAIRRAPSQLWVETGVHDPVHEVGLPLRPRLTAFGGGLPLQDGRRVLGGIGVSGGSAAQDEICAAAGLRAAGMRPI